MLNMSKELKYTKISVPTTAHNSFHEITNEVKDAVKNSNVKEGLCLVFIPHTTAALTVTSYWDLKGLQDIQDEIDRLVPTRIDFKHQYDTPRDAAGHVKSSLLDISKTFIVDDGELVIGGSQGIFFLEFDGPRNRQVFVRVLGQ